jgi:hypothetical protein
MMKTMTRASARSFLMPIRNAENMKGSYALKPIANPKDFSFDVTPQRLWHEKKFAPPTW